MREHRIAGLLLASVGIVTATAWSQKAIALEPGAAPQTTPGINIGTTAKPMDPGIYFSDTALTYQSKQVGPGAEAVNGDNANLARGFDAAKVTVVPGWTFLGATYSAAIVQKALMKQIGPPVNTSASGLGNTLLSPIQLTWNAGYGFFIQANAGVYVPDGTTAGATGTGNVGDPYWTFQPQLILSYLNDGWAFTANIYDEINTKNRISGYTTGQIFHTDFTATKTIGRWTIGPVAYLVDQITSDSSSAAYEFNNQGKFTTFAIGGLVGYDFGPAKINVWATDEIYAHAYGGTPGPGRNETTQGFTVFGQVSFKAWPLADEAPPPARPLITK